MIHTNNISTEASAGTSSIGQSKHQGTKTSKTLFSTLLAMLQKGTSQNVIQQTVQQGSHKNTVVSTSESKNKNQSLTNQQGNKNLQHSLSQTSNIDAKIKHILQQAKNADSTDKKSLNSKKSQHALAQTNITQTIKKKQQHHLVQTGKVQTADNNPQHILQQSKSTQTADKNVQHILAQADKKPMTNQSPAKTLTQDIPGNTNNVDASDAIASLQEAQLTPLAANTNKNSSAIDGQLNKQANLATSQTTTPNISPELLAEASNKKNQASQNIAQQNTKHFTATMQNAQQNSSQQNNTNKQIEQQITTQQSVAQQANQINNSLEQANDGIKTSQAAIAAVQQRTGNQTQQTQAANTSAVTTTNSPNAISMTVADNNTASQQDLNANQHDADMSLLDAAKTDNKNAKGLDFQAQLAYKSQRTFTPADTMLEIVKSAKTGNTTLELQLEPANLGKVQVSIQMDQAKHIQVMFTVDQTASKQALEQQMPQLKLAMAQQGLDLGGCSMQMNQQGGQQQSGSQQTTNNNATGSSLDATTLTHSNDEQNTRIGVNLATQGHLSILA